MDLDGRPVTLAELEALALYNYGHFTSMRSEAGRIRGLSMHLDRLVHDCQILFRHQLDPERIRQLARRAVAAGRAPEIVRITVCDPALKLARPGGELAPRILVSTRPAPPAVSPPLRVASVRFIRELPTVKHTGIFGSIYQRRCVQQTGYDDALFVTDDFMVAEGATWNIGFWDGERIIWPRADYLPGVTMRLLRETFPDSVSAPVQLRELGGMRVAFATNSSVGIQPIASIDNITFDTNAPILTTLTHTYHTIPPDPL